MECASAYCVIVEGGVESHVEGPLQYFALSASINRLRGALYEGCSLRYALTNILDVNTVSKPILRLLISHAGMLA